MNIGFFDSGLGGLLMLKAVAKALPQYDYVYYADTANLPYGDKTEEEIYELTKSGIEELFNRDCLLVVVACNTSSAESLRRIQDTYLKEGHPKKRILGVIVPTVEEVVETSSSARVLLIGTKRTVESGKYVRELDKVSGTMELVSIATPELVPLIELHELEVAADSAIKTIRDATREGDVVILGCTHYVMLKDSLRDHFKDSRTIVSQDEVIPKKLADYLIRHEEIASNLSNTGKRHIHLTLHRPDYDRLTAEFLGGVYMPDES